MTSPPPQSTRYSSIPRHSSAAWYLASTAVGSATPLLTLPIITRVLEPEEFGAWVLAYAYGVFISALSNFGMVLVYERSFFATRDAAESAALLWTTLVFVAGLLTSALVCTWIWRETLSAWMMQTTSYSSLLFWTSCAVGVSNLKIYFLTYFRNRGEARNYAIFSIDEVVLGAIGSVLLVAWFRVGPEGLAWGPLAASTIVLSFLVAHIVRRLPVRLGAAQLKASLWLGLPLLPRVFLAVFGQVFDKWLVGLVASTGGVAGYAIGQRLAYVAFTISTTLENVFQPRTYRLMFDGGESGGKDIGTMLTPFAYATVGAALAVGLAAEEVIAFLAPESYAGAVAVTTVLVLHFAILFFGKQPQLLYAKKTGVLSALSSLGVLFNAAAMWFFAMRYGAVGAAIGTAVSGFLMTSLSVRVSQRYYRIEYERKMLMLLYAYLVLALAVTYLLQAAAEYPVRFSAKFVFLAAYLWIGHVFRWWAPLIRYARRGG
ncbi:MAG: lipopolysaccharide biosynthesis protein [Betaproteobacteria bacterium]|nr:lipopolysaccharide biosynthesis protein [Betaproteobacteria bacterium]